MTAAGGHRGKWGRGREQRLPALSPLSHIKLSIMPLAQLQKCLQNSCKETDITTGEFENLLQNLKFITKVILRKAKILVI
jgi:hypothetical protein